MIWVPIFIVMFLVLDFYLLAKPIKGMKILNIIFGMFTLVFGFAGFADVDVPFRPYFLIFVELIAVMTTIRAVR